jgi:hypothetical protein
VNILHADQEGYGFQFSNRTEVEASFQTLHVGILIKVFEFWTQGIVNLVNVIIFGRGLAGNVTQCNNIVTKYCT